MRLFDLTKTFKGFNNEILQIEENGKERDVTLSDVFSKCLSIKLSIDKDDKEEDSYKKYQIWQKLRGNNIVELSNEEIIILLKRIHVLENVVIYGQCREYLEGSGETRHQSAD